MTATTSPVRKPSEKKLTSSTIADRLGEHARRTRRPTRAPLRGWSLTLRSSHADRQRASAGARTRASSVLPSAMMSPPSFIATRDADRVLAHEAHLRRGRIDEAAVHRRRRRRGGTVRSPARIGKSRIASTESNAPLDAQLHAVAARFRRSRPASPRSAASSACCTAASGDAERGQLACCDARSQIFSSCRPTRSTLPTSGTRCSSSCDALGVVLQHRVVEAVAGERVDVAEGVAELVVEERADTPSRQRRRGCRRPSCAPGTTAPARPSDGIESRAMKITCDSPGREYAADELVLAGRHQLLLDALGDLRATTSSRGRARPQRAHHHRLEGEGRVLRLAEVPVRPRADQREHQHRVDHQRAVAQRPLGQVEAAHASLRLGGDGRSTGRLSRSTGATRWPSRSRCPPAATTQSLGATPREHRHAVSPNAPTLHRREMQACATPGRPPTARCAPSAPRWSADSGTRQRIAVPAPCR